MMLKKTLRLFGLATVLTLASSTLAIAGTDGKKLPSDKNFPSLLSNPSESPLIKRQSDSLFNLMGLSIYGLEKDVFFTAYKGYKILMNKKAVRKKELLTICDYSQSSNNKRLYVIDLKESRLLFNTYVSHGKNSGGEYATSFSNLRSSNKSSLGFLITAETYRGTAGYSMRFDGMEAGINDRVRARDIVLHGSNFVNAHVVEERGMIGNSLGCPAVPAAMHKQIIDAIKGGSCFFINHPDSWYVHNSTIINSSFDLESEILGTVPQALVNEIETSVTAPAPGGSF